MANLAEIKNWFRIGLKPTQEQFWSTWDSFWHKESPIPQNAVQDLEITLADKVEGSDFEEHLKDPYAHVELFSAINSGEKRLNYFPRQDSLELQLNQFIGMQIDAIAVFNQFFTDGYEFDSKTGVLKWAFEKEVKHLIFYSKETQEK